MYCNIDNSMEINPNTTVSANPHIPILKGFRMYEYEFLYRYDKAFAGLISTTGGSSSILLGFKPSSAIER